MDSDPTSTSPVGWGDPHAGSGAGSETVDGQMIPAFGAGGDALSQLPFGMGHRMLTISEVAEWFRVPVKTVRGWVNRRNIPYRKVGDLLRFPEQELEAWSMPRPKVTEPTVPRAKSDGTSPHVRPVPGRRYKSVKLGVSYDA